MKERTELKKIDFIDINNAVSVVRNSFDLKYLTTSIYCGDGICIYINEELSNSFSPYVYYGLYTLNKLVAYAEFKLYKETSTVFLNMIAVDKKFINKKFGTNLLNKAIDEFIKKKYKYLELDVYSSNSNALNWYIKMGFVEYFEKNFYELKINSFEFSEPYRDIQIFNFPQTCTILKKFGFSQLYIKLFSREILMGIISENLIIRDSLDSNLLFAIKPLMNVFNLKKAYYIGNDNAEYLTLNDSIKRLKLNLE